MQLLLAMAMQFQEVIALPLHVKISVCSMCCTGNSISSETEQLKTRYSLAIFLSANIAKHTVHVAWLLFPARWQRSNF